jgi:acetoin utilization deacetylase AcuC-like enzyme
MVIVTAQRLATHRPAVHGSDGSGSDRTLFVARGGQIASQVVTVLFATHAAYLEHLAGPRHPERPERLQAVLDGVELAGLHDAIEPLAPEAATRDELERVHPAHYLDRIEGIVAAGGGRLDADTYASAGSWLAATLAAGAGLTAVRALQAGRGSAAFCAVRPPGHHATTHESMGFCFVNNVAVVAAALADQGERVMIFDYDAHHGNGTQAVFYHDPRVLFVSLHQWPLYPGTGRHTEVGEGAARGTTVNIPLPPGATGDVYLYAFDELVAPIADRFRPTWVIISAGFDAHRNDPITELSLAAGDYAPLTARALSLVPAGRRLVMLEGGYDLDALTLSSATVLRELADESGAPWEKATAGGPGGGAVRRAFDFWQLEDLL